MKATHLLISGCVQGVGFRFFAEREARRLGIRGHVRNLPDGRVEAVAAGPDDRMLEFIERLRQGPGGSRVEGLESRAAELDENVRGFDIRG
jgi:acylphosphatase